MDLLAIVDVFLALVTDVAAVRSGGTPWHHRTVARGRVLMLDAAYRPLAEEHAEFTVAAPVSVGMGHREVWLLGLPEDEDEEPDKMITHAAVAERGRRVASLDRQVRLFCFLEFEPLGLEEVRSAVLPRHRPHIATSTPPAAWGAALLAVERLRPDAAQGLRRLRRLIGETTTRSVSGALRLEKDAVGLALEMSGMGRKRYLREWLPPSASAGFLSGLSSVRLREDQVVQHDAGVFGDWMLPVTDDEHGDDTDGGERALTRGNVAVPLMS